MPVFRILVTHIVYCPRIIIYKIVGLRFSAATSHRDAMGKFDGTLSR